MISHQRRSGDSERNARLYQGRRLPPPCLDDDELEETLGLAAGDHHDDDETPADVDHLSVEDEGLVLGVALQIINVTTPRCWQNLDDLTPGIDRERNDIELFLSGFILVEAVNNLVLSSAIWGSMCFGSYR